MIKKFLYRIFNIHKYPDDDSLVIDESSSSAVVNNISNNDYYEENENFYIHDNPDDITERNNMPVETLEQEYHNGTTQIVDGNGQTRTVSIEQGAQYTENVPAGLSIPGVGYATAPKTPQARNNMPQQQPQYAQPQQPPQQQYVQQPLQQQYVQQPPQQQYVQQPVAPQPVRQAPVQQQAPVQRTSVPVQPKRQVQNQAQGFPNFEVATIEGIYHMYMDLPGIERKSLKIEFANGNLIVKGKRGSKLDQVKKVAKPKVKDTSDSETKTKAKQPKPKKVKVTGKLDNIPKFLMGAFSYEFPFEKMIDETQIDANLDDGVLHVTLPHRSKGETVSVSIS